MQTTQKQHGATHFLHSATAQTVQLHWRFLCMEVSLCTDQLRFTGVHLHWLCKCIGLVQIKVGKEISPRGKEISSAQAVQFAQGCANEHWVTLARVSKVSQKLSKGGLRRCFCSLHRFSSNRPLQKPIESNHTVNS